VIDTLRVWSRVSRAEGAAAVADRLVDRWREAQPRFRPAGSAGGARPAVPVLNVIGVAMTARGGGVPMQLRARLRHESSDRPVAVLSRRPNGGFDLERRSGGRWDRRSFAGTGWNGDPLCEEPGWLDVVREASRWVGARAVHVENLAGLSLASVVGLPSGGLPMVLSLHDFAAFCRRPHLWQSSGGFCGYSTNADRCQRCLAASSDSFAIDQQRHRSLGTEALRAATALIFPSQFLRTRLAALLPSGARVSEVISPGVEAPGEMPAYIRRAEQVAFIGGGADHKGGARLAPLAQALVAGGAAVTVYGFNGHDHLARLRRIRHVSVRGYFRTGSLPGLLARQGAAVALLLPGFPETFSLALSDAWAAGVPVVAPSQGAMGERLQHGGGLLISADPSDTEVLKAIDRVRRTPVGVMPPPPLAIDAARRHLDLYRRCGFSSV
jgi:glycosyltransferase involved in cell wall biosynthesis